MIRVVGQDDNDIGDTKRRALEILQSQREAILSGGRLRAIVVVSLFDPTEKQQEGNTATVTHGDWQVDKGIAPAELVGVLFGIASSISRGDG